jgi:hypothetical protein
MNPEQLQTFRSLEGHFIDNLKPATTTSICPDAKYIFQNLYDCNQSNDCFCKDVINSDNGKFCGRELNR